MEFHPPPPRCCCASARLALSLRRDSLQTNGNMLGSSMTISLTDSSVIHQPLKTQRLLVYTESHMPDELCDSESGRGFATIYVYMQLFWSIWQNYSESRTHSICHELQGRSSWNVTISRGTAGLCITHFASGKHIYSGSACCRPTVTPPAHEAIGLTTQQTHTTKAFTLRMLRPARTVNTHQSSQHGICRLFGVVSTVDMYNTQLRNLPMLFLWNTEQQVHADTQTQGENKHFTNTRINEVLPAVWWGVQGYLCQLFLDSAKRGRAAMIILSNTHKT